MGKSSHKRASKPKMARTKTPRFQAHPILGLNEDREGAHWQEKRGARYGNNRKLWAGQKVKNRRRERQSLKKECTAKD